MKNLSALLSKDPEFIYVLLEQIKEGFKTLMPFGASNSVRVDKLYFAMDDKDIESLNFPPDANFFERARVLARHELTYDSEPPHVDVFIKGIGVCSHLNFFALMVLAKEYDFVARLENIHSDETHTYVVLSDSDNKDYILDFWSGSALAYDNDVEWNETVPFKYARKKDYSISYNSFWSAHYLRSLWPQLENPEVLETKKKYYDYIITRAFKCPTPVFFAPKVSTVMLFEEEEVKLIHGGAIKS